LNFFTANSLPVDEPPALEQTTIAARTSGAFSDFNQAV
jgi:hypothetical protein